MHEDDRHEAASRAESLQSHWWVCPKQNPLGCSGTMRWLVDLPDAHMEGEGLQRVGEWLYSWNRPGGFQLSR
jgi:hypothetical protein